TFGILVVLLILCSIASPQYFLTRDNLVQVLLQSSVMVLLACGGAKRHRRRKPLRRCAPRE
ncbi:hypothetical protein ACRXB1_33750, partial [Caballeronia sp. M23-90]